MTDSPLHPARTIPIDDLFAGLGRAVADGYVYRRRDPASGLDLYCYTSRAVFDEAWDQFTTLARGLIVHPATRLVVATPFPKFFNLGERHGTAPDLPFEAFEKLDGSLIIAFHFAGAWRCATKGSFDSQQAAWAQTRLDAADLSTLVPGTTYLFEAVYPENRIVVRYDDPTLVLLAAYDSAGRELTYAEIEETATALGWRAAKRHTFSSIPDMVMHTATLSKDDEGLVVRFTNGLRLKLKGAEYRRIHALISRCTPLAMWESLAVGDDMAAIRRDLPEEFWADFDDIVRLLRKRIVAAESKVAAFAVSVADLTDKELGLRLATVPDDVRPYIYVFRKLGGIVGKPRDSLLRLVRPTGNVLPGYVPSYVMGRVLDDAIG